MLVQYSAVKFSDGLIPGLSICLGYIKEGKLQNPFIPSTAEFKSECVEIPIHLRKINHLSNN